MPIKRNNIYLWRHLVDFGFESAKANLLHKGKNYAQAMQELKQSLRRQSKEHLEGIIALLKNLKQ